MVRWLMLVLMVVGFALVFVTKSPAVLGFGLLLALVGLFGLVFGLAADRVSANARPESAMLDSEDLAALRARRAAAAKPAGAAPSPTAPPPRTPPSS